MKQEEGVGGGIVEIRHAFLSLGCLLFCLQPAYHSRVGGAFSPDS